MKKDLVIAIAVVIVGGGGCAPMLLIDGFACPDGGATSVESWLLPHNPGNCWENVVSSPAAAFTPFMKRNVLEAPERMPDLGLQTNCDKAGVTAIPSRRDQTDGSSGRRWMTVEDDPADPNRGAVWWEEDARFGPDGAASMTQVDCRHTGDRAKLRVPGAADLASGEFLYDFEETSLSPDAATNEPVRTDKICSDHWTYAGQRDRDIASGSFKVDRFDRTISCFSADKDTPCEESSGACADSKLKCFEGFCREATAPLVAHFEFARGIGKVYEETEGKEIEELSSWYVSW